MKLVEGGREYFVPLSWIQSRTSFLMAVVMALNMVRYTIVSYERLRLTNGRHEYTKELTGRRWSSKRRQRQSKRKKVRYKILPSLRRRLKTSGWRTISKVILRLGKTLVDVVLLYLWILIREPFPQGTQLLLGGFADGNINSQVWRVFKEKWVNYESFLVMVSWKCRICHELMKQNMDQ